MNQLPWPLPPTMSNRKFEPLLSTEELDVPLEILAEIELIKDSEKSKSLGSSSGHHFDHVRATASSSQRVVYPCVLRSWRMLHILSLPSSPALASCTVPRP